MDDVLLSAIRIIEGIDGTLDNFGPTYLFTTENISGFSEKISFLKKRVFSVCSSGDQAFNMKFNGASDVDVFDINIFSKYFFRLKEAAIKNLSYDEFLDFFIPKNKFNTNVFSLDTYLEFRNDVKDDKIRKFWDFLFCNYSGKELSNSNLFFNYNYPRSKYIKCNDYLKNEDNYNILKAELKKDNNISFYSFDLFNDEFPTDKKYDFVYLSNIFDYLWIEDSLEYIKKVKDIILNIKNNLSLDGKIAISYLYFYYDDYYVNNAPNNLNSHWIRKEIMKDADYISFPGASDPFSYQIRNKDALMLYKKK